MSVPQPGQDAHLPPQERLRQRISPEELRVLHECSRDAFWRRSLPLTVVLCGAVAYAAKRKMVAANNMLGLLPKYSVAIFSGYLIGKLSYVSECNRRFMRLRAQRQDTNLDTQASNVIAELGREQPLRYQPDAFGSHLERDQHAGDRPPEHTSDSYYEGGSLGPPSGIQRGDSAGTRHSTSYDDLRRENRAEYERSQRRAASHSQEPNLPFSKLDEREASPRGYREGTKSDSNPADGSLKRNKYGDVYE